MRKAVETLSTAGLNGMVAGIVDYDQGERAEGQIYVLGRYATENYLLDPIVMYVFLLDRSLAPKTEFEIALGEEAKLGEFTDEQLQQIADAVLSIFEPNVRENLPHELNSERTTVRYVNGRKVLVPTWLCRERGHDLLHALTGITPAARSREELVKAFKRVRLVPAELKEIFEKTIGYIPAFDGRERPSVACERISEDPTIPA